MGRLPDGQCDVDNTHPEFYGPVSCCALAAVRQQGFREGVEAAASVAVRWVAEHCTGRYESGAARSVELRAVLASLTRGGTAPGGGE